VNRAAALCSALALLPTLAAADPLDVVNAVRLSGCGGEPVPALARSSKLDDAA
jgi:hypothetical protein